MNVLLLSGGRRTSLLAAFQVAASAVGGEVSVADVDGLAPAAFAADTAHQVPPVSSADYPEALIRVVSTFNVDVVVPTIDTELAVLANLRADLQALGALALVSAHETLMVTGDKLQTFSFFNGLGIRTPRSWLPDEAAAADLPRNLFIKPRFGSSSKGAQPTTLDRLESVIPQVNDPIIQERISEPEVTVDALLDLAGRPVHYVPRLRLKTVGGESVQGRTIDDAPYRGWILQVLEALGETGAIGPQTLQFFMTPGEPTLLEVNPRFGGGFPLAHAAGASYPEWILAMVSGQRLESKLGKYARDLFMTRTLTETFTEAPLW